MINCQAKSSNKNRARKAMSKRIIALEKGNSSQLDWTHLQKKHKQTKV